MDPMRNEYLEYRSTSPAVPRATNDKREVQLIGHSAEMARLQQEISRIALSDAKVLVQGETGSGKDLVAHAIHERGRRANRVFAPVNCAGIPETLLESELFGHVRGSFTGAYRDKTGKLEAAHMGTIFLDEIGEMSLRMQGLLLRVLETGELQKVGADGGGRCVDVRVIAATNRDLHDMVRQREFREDLFYRLNVITITVPPVRDHRDDIPALVEHFLSRISASNRTSITDVTPEALRLLTSYSWPGNVREIENVIERIVICVTGSVIDVGDLPSDIRAQNRAALRPRHERRQTVADDLYQRMVHKKESFWATAYPLFMSREITREHVREVIRRGLQETRGNYKIVLRLFNMESSDYKRFLNFLRKHECQLPFKEYR